MLAAAALMFAACAQFDTVNEVPESEPQAIGFDTYAQMTTRAAENSTATGTNALSDHHDSFEVWAYKNTDETNYVFGTDDDQGVRVAYDAVNLKWGYTGTKYWDKAASKYEFYAAAPEGQNWVLNAKTVDQADDYFTLADFALTGTTLANSTSLTSSFSSVGDIDLMIASEEPVTTIPPTSNIVQLDFNHILSRLNISVVKGANIAAGDQLVLTGISVNNLVKNGSFTEEIAAVQTGTTQRWLAASTPADYDITGNTLNPVTTTATYVFQALVIPQQVTAEDLERDGSDVNETTSKPYLTLSYTIAGEPYSATFNLSKAFAPSAAYYDFFEGYQHTLNITIDASAISFQANAFVWDVKDADHVID